MKFEFTIEQIQFLASCAEQAALNHQMSLFRASVLGEIQKQAQEQPVEVSTEE